MPNDEHITNPAVNGEPFPPEPTPEQIEEWERERAEREAAKIAPSQAAKNERNSITEIVAEHDDLIADILYEITLSDIGV